MCPKMDEGNGESRLEMDDGVIQQVRKDWERNWKHARLHKCRTRDRLTPRQNDGSGSEYERGQGSTYGPSWRTEGMGRRREIRVGFLSFTLVALSSLEEADHNNSK